jgi:hypothetical protein
MTRAGKLIAGTAGFVAVVAAVAVLFVLPSEYGIDPTGFGKMAGLTQIAAPAATSPELERGAKRSGVLTLSEAAPAPLPGRTDHWEWELGPFESIEFKYTLPERGRMAFAWSAPVPVRYDMHAHPFAGGTALTESYGVADAAKMQGTYVAPFTGIHGWYWQNRTLEPVKLTLDASGGITESTIFDSTGEHKRELQGR